jgi:hypothetical protein
MKQNKRSNGTTEPDPPEPSLAERWYERDRLYSRGPAAFLTANQVDTVREVRTREASAAEDPFATEVARRWSPPPVIRRER